MLNKKTRCTNVLRWKTKACQLSINAHKSQQQSVEFGNKFSFLTTSPPLGFQSSFHCKAIYASKVLDIAELALG